MKKLKLKPFVLPTLYAIIVVTLLLTVIVTRKEYEQNQKESTIYVTSSILDSYIPVVNSDIKIIRPYLKEDVTIGIDYYNQNDDEEHRRKSIIYYENTYMPNSGIDYVNDEIFEVVSILDGEVIEVEQEELLGNVVTIRHDNDIISIYQSLSEVSVTKGSRVSQGQVIGKSGTAVLNKNLNNHLHFELIIDGSLQDPEDYYGKNINEIN